MNSAIRTEHLEKKFHRVEALHDLNLEVPTGAIYGLVGPNGAGKTTAIKILMNILLATSGRAEVLGKVSSKLAGQAFTSIGYVSENQRLPDWMRVDAFFAYLRPFYPSWDRDLEDELVKQFQLPLDRKLAKLSRGTHMKAALASSLAYRPKLIVLDEPFGGLDPLVRDEVIEGLLERASESTILVSSHDLADIENLVSHIGYLDRGYLRLSEEMTTLAARFREVELTLDQAAVLPATLPDTWTQVSASAAVVRFIDSRFNEERTIADIRKWFGEVRNVNFAPMSLRSIFLAMAKAGRDTA
jgi:ABC-2 type transport system ATP-binding protein